MNELSDRRLAWQPDIYQRYSFLARLTDILAGDGSGALTLLDVGSGPVALTKAFVSPRFDIVRADAGQFDDPSIVQLQPGEPLPFEDAAFDVAIAIEVLEHVPPAQRPSLIRELQRVSRQATIVCCPIDTPEVVEAERQFSAYAKAVSGRDVDFLVEHRENGLPDAAEVVSWFSEPGSVLVADNAPLDEWLAFNMLDFIYACDLGDDEAKGRFAAAVNTRAPLARVGAAHYRRFFCAFTSPAHAATASRVIDAARSPDPIEPQRLVRELVTGILGWRQELRERSTRETEAIHRHVGELDAVLLRFKEAVAEKDAHIGKLDDALGELGRRVVQRGAQGRSKPDEGLRHARARRQNRTMPLRVAAHASSSTSDRAQLDQKRSGKPRSSEIEVAASSRLLGSIQRPVGGARATRGEHTASDSPRTRAADHPDVPFVAGDGAATANHGGAPAPDLHRQLPSGAVGRMRRRLRERVTRHRDYALAAGAACSTRHGIGSAIPMWATPKSIHWCTISNGVQREGRDPHPLFDSSFYLAFKPQRRRRWHEPARALL